MVNSFEPTSSLPRMLSELLLLLSTKSKHRSLCCGQRLSINHPLLPAVPCSFHAFFLTLVRIAAKSFPCPCLFMLISLSLLSLPFSPFLSLSLPFSLSLLSLSHFLSSHFLSSHSLSSHSLSFLSSLLSLLPSFPSSFIPPPFSPFLPPSLSFLPPSFLSVPPFSSLFLPLSSLFLFPPSISSFPFPFLCLSLLFLARPCSALLFRFSFLPFSFCLSFVFYVFVFSFFFSFLFFLLSHFPFSSFPFFLFRFFCFLLFFFFFAFVACVFPFFFCPFDEAKKQQQGRNDVSVQRSRFCQPLKLRIITRRILGPSGTCLFT